MQMRASSSVWSGAPRLLYKHAANFADATHRRGEAEWFVGSICNVSHGRVGRWQLAVFNQQCSQQPSRFIDPPGKKVSMRVVAVILALVCVGHTLAAPAYPFIASITQSGDFSQQNLMMQFDATNVTHVFASENYPYFESTVGSAVDHAKQRWFLYQEGFQVTVFDALSLKLNYTLEVPFVPFFSPLFHSELFWICHATCHM
jgi:hypothetical protein